MTKLTAAKQTKTNSSKNEISVLFSSDKFLIDLKNKYDVDSYGVSRKLSDINIKDALGFSTIIIELPKNQFDIYKLGIKLKRWSISENVIGICSKNQIAQIKRLQHIDHLFTTILSIDDFQLKLKYPMRLK